MDEVEAARAAARDAVGNVMPSRLQERIDRRLASASMLPGVLTLLAARVGGGFEDGDNGLEDPGVARRAAGTQLIYEGLRLTRSLVGTDPWARADDPSEDLPADLDVLAADVLVARGFALLADTPASDQAVETVRAFGRRETDREAGRAPADRSLEANVFDLAAVAGATIAAPEAPLGLRQYCVGLARAHAIEGDGDASKSLPRAAETLPERIEEVMTRVTERGEPARPASPD
jgi:hypothetical protein